MPRAWTQREDAALRILSPDVAATKFGRSLTEVAARLEELGINHGERRTLKPAWTPEEDAVVMALPQQPQPKS